MACVLCEHETCPGHQLLPVRKDIAQILADLDAAFNAIELQPSGPLAGTAETSTRVSVSRIKYNALAYQVGLLMGTIKAHPFPELDGGSGSAALPPGVELDRGRFDFDNNRWEFVSLPTNRTRARPILTVQGDDRIIACPRCVEFPTHACALCFGAGKVLQSEALAKGLI